MSINCTSRFRMTDRRMIYPTPKLYNAVACRRMAHAVAYLRNASSSFSRPRTRRRIRFICVDTENPSITSRDVWGNSCITSDNGVAFAEIVGRFAMEKICGMRRRERADGNERAGDPNARWEETEHTNNARLWTSSLLRTIQTAAHIEHPAADERPGGSKWRLASIATSTKSSPGITRG